MLRSDIVQGASQVLDALDKTKLVLVLRALISHSEKEKATADVVLEAMRQYDRLSQKFTPSARELCKIMGLDFLGDTAFWSVVSQADDRTQGIVHDTTSRFSLQLHTYQRFLIFSNANPTASGMNRKNIQPRRF